MLNALVIFGASGDLTSRKLIPALFELFYQKKLPLPITVVGIARTPMTDRQWQSRCEAMIPGLDRSDRSEAWTGFCDNLHYIIGTADSASTLTTLERRLAEQMHRHREESLNCLYYLAVAPELYPAIIRQLGDCKMTTGTPAIRRAIVIEKPFGRDLETAKKLNQILHQTFTEDRIFRIDHYLGKETVNNIFALRFANTIFEPLWNRNYIDHVQITAGESLSVSQRGAFYESTGILRDMFQNHLLQLLSIIAMEPPVRFDAQSIRDEKVKVLQSIYSVSDLAFEEKMVLGQYEGYHREAGVAHDSKTPTFAAIRLMIDNWRWLNVPFFLRSGKAMSCQTTQICIYFKKPPHFLFEHHGKYDAILRPNRLLIQIQPAEGIMMSFMSTVPGTEMQLRETQLSFHFKDYSGEKLPDSYQRLILDAFQGDPSLFTRNDEVEAAWKVIDPFIQQSEKQGAGKPGLYPQGDWGPPESNQWLAKSEKEWFDSCPILH